MKEYVRVPGAMPARLGELAKYLNVSYEYAKTPTAQTHSKDGALTGLIFSAPYRLRFLSVPRS
jgi:hypothetical protein